MENNKTFTKIHITDVENQNLNRTMPLKPINSNNKIDNESVRTSVLDKSILLSPIFNDLIDLGYNEIYSKRIILFYHPNNLNQALDYFSEENGKINHIFQEDNQDKFLCFFCGQLKEDHKEDIYEPINHSFNDNISINNNNNNNNEILDNREPSFNVGEGCFCQICLKSYDENMKIELECGHLFCESCWYNYLKVKILENKLKFIKCLEYECNQIIPDEIIRKIIKKNEKLLEKYNQYKFKLDIINDPNKKFCPFPNCNSFLIKNENEINSKCENGHEYCFKCLNEPHGKKECDQIIDVQNIKEYAKNTFIKQCPKCGIYTEKNKGCNHITCAECNYEWCWLCNQHYSESHFNQGKCKGYQFFQPLNENDIKLAFEGKIVLKESERQFNFDNDFYDRPEPLTASEKRNFIFLTFLFLLIGRPISEICNSPCFIDDRSYYYQSTTIIITTCFYFCVIYLWMVFFFLKVFINIIILICCILHHGKENFYREWVDCLNKILCFNVFEDYNQNNILFITKKWVFRIIFNIFFSTLFTTSLFIYRETTYDIKGRKIKKVFYFFYIGIMFLFQFIFFFLQILMNIIYMTLIIIDRGLESLYDVLKRRNNEFFSPLSLI